MSSCTWTNDFPASFIPRSKMNFPFAIRIAAYFCTAPRCLGVGIGWNVNEVTSQHRTDPAGCQTRNISATVRIAGDLSNFFSFFFPTGGVSQSTRPLHHRHRNLGLIARSCKVDHASRLAHNQVSFEKDLDQAEVRGSKHVMAERHVGQRSNSPQWASGDRRRLWSQRNAL